MYYCLLRNTSTRKMADMRCEATKNRIKMNVLTIIHESLTYLIRLLETGFSVFPTR